MRHNNLRDFKADMLSKMVNDVETEPELQSVKGEVIEGLSGKLQDLILEQEVCGELARMLFSMLG